MSRLFSACILVLGTAFLVGCDQSVSLGTPQEVKALTLPTVSSTFLAEFDPAKGILPFPNNLLFSGSSDGTLNIPIGGSVNPNVGSDPANDYSNPKVVLNTLDGFSTVAPLSVTFSADVDSTTVTANSVRLYEVGLTQGAVTSIKRTLIFGVDYLPVASGGSIGILLLKALQPQSSYLVALSDDLRSVVGEQVISSSTYLLAKRTTSLLNADGSSAEAGLSDVEAQGLERLRQAVNLQEAQIAAAGLAADKVVLSWSFSTQSVGLVLEQVRQQVSAVAAISPTSIGTTAQLLPGTAGISDVYVGSLTLPYYLQDTSDNPFGPLRGFWRGGANSFLTAFNPKPLKYVDQKIPLLISIPNASSGQNKPATGWPVVIFQHDITSNRSSMLALADAVSQAGFATVSIDLPLHGITDTGNVLYTQFERTFDVDYVTEDPNTGAITAQAADQVFDSSGRHFFNFSSLLTLRDNMRQGVADLFALQSTLATLDYDGDAVADFDAATVRFVGHSLGAMVGIPFLALESSVGAAVLAMPGGGIAKLLDGSATFGPAIAGGLEVAAGLVKGSAEYEAFMVVTQTALDSADPLNYAQQSVAKRGVMLLEVVGGVSSPADLVVPNHVGTLAQGFADVPAGTVPGPLSGTDPLALAMALPKVNAAINGVQLPVWLRFTSGDHSSILSPAADLAVTVAMQTVTAAFVASNGSTVALTPEAVTLLE